MPRPRSALVLGAVMALAVGVGSAGGVRQVPPNGQNARIWLGQWKSNFGTLFFTDVYHAKSDVPDVNGDPQYYWAVQGRWTMPNGIARRFHGALDPRDHTVYQGCYETGPGANAPCYPMLIYIDAAGKRIQHGYWKPCYLPENCHAHHPWSGDKAGPEWRAGFRFTQRGPPDGQRVIRTQTGGAGSLLWAHRPVASRLDGAVAAHGSALFYLDEITGGENLTVNVALRRGHLVSYGSGHEPHMSAVLEGLVTSSNDPHCHAGQYAAVTLDDRPAGKADRIELRIDGCRQVQRWTSTDPQRVSVHLGDPRRVG